MKRIMISLVISVLAITALLADTVTVEKPDGDGEDIKEQERILEAKKQIEKIREELNVMAKSKTPEVDEVTVYRLHLHRNADGSEVACLVGEDGVERPVKIIDPDEYKLLTERLQAVWYSLNSTSDGRIKLHGKIERTEIDEKARKKVEIYADGYRHTETLPAKRKSTEVKITCLQEKKEEKKPKWMSDKQWEMRQAFKKFRQGVPKQVTVEHDAMTGKDTVVK